jgi:inner membrane protein
MDIVTHTLSGIAVGTILAMYKKSNKCILFGGIGGALPDVDAISLWSGFDGTIGKLCGLSHSGHDIYFGKYWYSHHAFMHSLLAAFLVGISVFWICKIYKSKNAFSYGMAVCMGFIMHLIGDMPTPGSTWGGVSFWWPSMQYVGGTGDVWWWNNYDIFLITLAVVIVNLIWLALGYFLKSQLFYKLGIVVLLTGIGLSAYQIKTRGYDFDYMGFSTDFGAKEEKSLAIQHKILGDKLFNMMQSIDQKIHLNF